MGGIRKGKNSLMSGIQQRADAIAESSQTTPVMPLPDDDVASLTKRKARSGMRRRGGRISTIFGESEGLGG